MIDPANPNPPMEIGGTNEVNFTPVESQRLRQNYEAVFVMWKALGLQGVISVKQEVGPATASQTAPSMPVSAETPPTLSVGREEALSDIDRALQNVLLAHGEQSG